MKFSDFRKYEPRRPSHAFVFVCEDDLLVEDSKPIWQRIFGGDWAFERLPAREFEAIDDGKLTEAALSPPLFGPSRALMVSDAGKTTAKKMAVAEEIAALPQSSLKIVFVTSSRRAVPKGSGALPLIEIDPVRAGDAARWLRDRYGVGPDVARYLVETVGTELLPLSAEMEKLTAYVREERPIGLRDIDLLTLRTEQVSPFDLDDAVFERDYAKAVRVAGAMLDEGVEPLILLSRLARAWRQLLVGKALAGVRAPQDAAAAASVPHWKARAFQAGCERFPMEALIRGFGELVGADRQFKTSAPNPAIVLDLLLWKLLRRERPAATRGPD